jgi:glycosyltransferase involved in cell wall biosynthesis
MSKPEISVVIPLYNEEKSIEALYQKLREQLQKRDESYEIIFIDDGSTDGSFEQIAKIHQSDSHVSAYKFKRNFGKSAGLGLGFEKAKGDLVVTMDADLQDDPVELPRMIEKIKQGYDLVSGWKFARLDPLSKRMPSKLYNLVLRYFSKVEIHDFNCGYKIYRKEVVKNIKIYGELHRYIPVLAGLKGYRVAEIKVRHHPRKYGRSKFGTRRFFGGFFDLLTVLFLYNYGLRPMHVFGPMGLLSLGLGLAINLYLTILWFVGNRPIGNRPLLALGFFLLVVGFQLFLIGFIAEMLTRSFFTTDEYPIEKKLE